MRILLTGYVHGDGGIQNHTYWLAQGLSERGHEVTVATSRPMHGHEAALLQNTPFNLVQVSRLRQVLRGYPCGEAVDFDVAVVCGVGWKSMLGPLLNRHIRKRVFFEVMSGERIANVDPRMLVHLGFDAIVAQAGPVERNFRAHFGWRRESITIPALSAPLELAGNVKPVDREPPARGNIRAVYCGRLARHKGVHLLVDRWEELAPNIGSLDVWGTGQEAEALQSKIDSAGLSDRIALRGRYPSGDGYISLLQQYDLKLLPTYGQEGAPLVLLEAMACGLPFVANGVGGIPDYDNPDCRVTSGDLAEFWPLVECIARDLYDGVTDRQRLHLHYMKNFSYRALCDRWEEFLLHVTKNNSGSMFVAHPICARHTVTSRSSKRSKFGSTAAKLPRDVSIS